MADKEANEIVRISTRKKVRFKYCGKQLRISPSLSIAIKVCYQNAGRLKYSFISQFIYEVKSINKSRQCTLCSIQAFVVCLCNCMVEVGKLIVQQHQNL